MGKVVQDQEPLDRLQIAQYMLGVAKRCVGLMLLFGLALVLYELSQSFDWMPVWASMFVGGLWLFLLAWTFDGLATLSSINKAEIRTAERAMQLQRARQAREFEEMHSKHGWGGDLPPDHPSSPFQALRQRDRY